MSTFVNGLFVGELKPNAIVGGCIYIYENAFPDPYGAISVIEQECVNPDSVVKFQKAETIGYGITQTHRTNYALNITHAAKSDNKICQDISNQMYTTLIATTAPYVQQMQINETTYHEEYSLLKYPISTEYKQHYDGSTSSGRSISAIVYLNDDYKGGEIEFPNFNVKIKPEAGMVILFPSNYAYAHIAHPVTSGTKYAIVTWIHDRVIQ